MIDNSNLDIYTIGHSTHRQEAFLAMLHTFHIEVLVDVRAYPGSRYLPHFNKKNMEIWLPENKIDYVHMRELGGRRRKNLSVDESLVAGWRHDSFRNYAAYALT